MLLAQASTCRLSERPHVAEASLLGSWGWEAYSHEWMGTLQILRKFCPQGFGA